MWLEKDSTIPAKAVRNLVSTVAVAVPARNEADLIGDCLAALDAAAGHAALVDCDVTVCVLVNNTADDTALKARAFCAENYTLVVDEIDLPGHRAHAGGARRAALDMAAALLPADGILMTTDADSSVSRDWIVANLTELAAGADAVAGVVAFDAKTRADLPQVPGRHLEWELAALHAELKTLLDPAPHDPWPTHIWAWGASFALTLSTYRAVGGLPEVPLAEDRALAAAIERADLKLRRSHGPLVYTSGRLAGRAPGGFADLLAAYVSDVDAACDAALEPTLSLCRRLRLKARLRDVHAQHGAAAAAKVAGLGEPLNNRTTGFGALWSLLEDRLPTLARHRLSPRQLIAEVALAKACVASFAVQPQSHCALRNRHQATPTSSWLADA